MILGLAKVAWVLDLAKTWPYSLVGALATQVTIGAVRLVTRGQRRLVQLLRQTLYNDEYCQPFTIIQYFILSRYLQDVVIKVTKY